MQYLEQIAPIAILLFVISVAISRLPKVEGRICRQIFAGKNQEVEGSRCWQRQSCRFRGFHTRSYQS